MLPLIAAAGAGALVSGVTNYLAARQQANAARDAAAAARRAGQAGAAEIRGSLNQSIGDINQGYNAGQGYLGQAGQLLAGGDPMLQQGMANNQALLGGAEGLFAQQRQVGSDALARINQAILGGDPNALQMDPGFAFRQQQGNQAIERAAAAAGSFGGGANLKDFARFNQNLASQEFGNAYNRALGLADMGNQAAAQTAGLRQNLAQLNQGLLGQRVGLLGQQAGVLGQQANLGVDQGQALAGLRQQTAANIANSLTGTQAQVNNFGLQRANAQAAQIAGIGNALNQFGQQAAFLGMMNGGGLGGMGGGLASAAMPGRGINLGAAGASMSANPYVDGSGLAFRGFA